MLSVLCKSSSNRPVYNSPSNSLVYTKAPKPVMNIIVSKSFVHHWSEISGMYHIAVYVFATGSQILTETLIWFWNMKCVSPFEIVWTFMYGAKNWERFEKELLSLNEYSRILKHSYCRFFQNSTDIKVGSEPPQNPFRTPPEYDFLSKSTLCSYQNPSRTPSEPPRMDFQFEVRVLHVTFWVVHKVLDSTTASSNLRSFSFIKSDYTFTCK